MKSRPSTILHCLVAIGIAFSLPTPLLAAEADEQEQFSGNLRFFAWNFPQRDIHVGQQKTATTRVALSNVGYSRRHAYNGPREIALYLEEPSLLDDDGNPVEPDFTASIPADRGDYLVILLPGGSHGHRALAIPEPGISNPSPYTWFNLTGRTLGVSWADQALRLDPMSHVATRGQIESDSFPVQVWDIGASGSPRLFSSRWATEQDKATSVFFFEDENTRRVEIRRIELPVQP